MDFNDTPAEAKFRDEARSWLKANVPTAAELEGLDYIGKAKLWQKRKYDAGWACLRWPKEYGGRGASAIEAVIWGQEESKYETPQSIFTIGQGMAAPTLMAYANDEHKQRFLPKLASGEEIWCQLFSEPAGGSDLAALRTSSEKRGDEWIVNGQKIWTSGAHYSDWGILVTRSDPTVPKHKGLTYFFLNMKSPGIEIKPIKQISGGANFNEVYFTDVRIPDSQRLGAVGQGWSVSLTTLMNERATIGGGGMGVNFNVAYKLAQKVMIDDRPGDRRQRRARETRELVRRRVGSEVHRLSDDDGAVARPDAGTGELDRQSSRRAEDAGHGVVLHGPARHVGRRERSGTCRSGRPAASDVHGRARRTYCRRHRRNPAEHPRRTRAWVCRRTCASTKAFRSTKSRPAAVDRSEE